MSTIAEQVAALQPGDVERLITLVRKAKEIAVVLDADRSLLDFRDLEKRLMALRNLKPAEPPCPFEMGAKVHVNGRHASEICEVVDWIRDPRSGEWLVTLAVPGGTWACEPERLSLVPDERIAELEGERDRARATAVTLEQELANAESMLRIAKRYLREFDGDKELLTFEVMGWGSFS